MDDRVGLGSGNRLADGSCIECIQHDRLGAECAKAFRLVG
jgi:hypothetical protein